MNKNKNLLDNIGYVIIETTPLDPSSVKPMEIVQHDDTRVKAQGILQEANMKNRNGRFYDSRDLFPELTSPRTLELLSTGNMKAENGHPISKDLSRQQTIDPNNTVAVFTKFWTDGEFVMGSFIGDENEKGEAFDRELRKGRRPSWSLRALGNIKNTARGAEVKNIKLITYDRVIYPSHDKAYTMGIVSESGIMVPDTSKIIIEEENTGMQIPIVTEQVMDYIKSESANYRVFKEFFDLCYESAALSNNGREVLIKDRAGSTFVMTLENYIHDEIMNHAIKNAF